MRHHGETSSRLIASYPGARVITLHNAGTVPASDATPAVFQELLALL
jgi:hypothetical protein